MKKGILLLSISLGFSFATECKYYTVQKGDTFEKIAKREKVAVKDLLSANKNVNEKSLREGQKICIPVKTSKRTTEKKETQQVTKEPQKYDFYQVKRGGKLEHVARVTGVPLKELERLNPELKDKWIQAGAKVKIPQRETQQAAKNRKDERSVIGEWERENTNIPTSPSLNISKFQPPVEGKISKVQKGIEIFAPCSAPVRAVEDGRVIYSGGDIQAYGNMVIIEHSNFISLYAYNEANLVKRGENVSKGQIIARVGKRNGNEECSLRFEIRNKEGVPLDPTEYISFQ